MTTAHFATHRSRLVSVAVLVGSLLAGSLAVAPVASAREEGSAIVVKYGDLDLSTTEGVTTLYKRISTAAHWVCPYDDARELALKAVNQSCRKASIERAVRSIHNAELASILDEHAKRG
jgi:UrcA family protein